MQCCWFFCGKHGKVSFWKQILATCWGDWSVTSCLKKTPGLKPFRRCSTIPRGISWRWLHDVGTPSDCLFLYLQILMAGNTLVGFYWREVILQEVSIDAWEFVGVCVPVVVIGAPLGSLIGTHFHRQVSTECSCFHPQNPRNRSRS